MSYEEFVGQIRERILSFLPEEYGDADVTVEEMIKNNDQKLQALHIKRPGDRVVPSIYLDSFYQMHQEGMEIDRILKNVAQLYHTGMEEGRAWQDFHVRDYDSVKDSLFITVQNRDNNREHLKDIVHMDIPGTDITAVLRIMCSKDQEKENVSIMVKGCMLDRWGVTGKDIYEHALKNTERLLPPKMMNIENVFSPDDNEGLESRDLKPYEIYVLSNDLNIHGAAAMLYPGLLQEIGEATGSSFYILPSSIHELILVRDNGDMSAEEFQHMVKTINRTQVRPDEVLSDEVYRFDHREQKLTMATDPARTKEYVEQMILERGCDDFLLGDDQEEMER